MTTPNAVGSATVATVSLGAKQGAASAHTQGSHSTTLSVADSQAAPLFTAVRKLHSRTSSDHNVAHGKSAIGRDTNA